MKRGIKNLPASIRAKLQNIAEEEGRPFLEVLQYYAMERFLYRLNRSQHADNFVLKGALMMIAWQIPERRTTLDIDLSAQADNSLDSIEEIIRDICSTAVTPDAVVFDPKTVKGERIKEDADYEGVRIKFKGHLDTAHISMQIDIAFGDVIYPKPELINYPSILDFPAPNLKGYPPESIISEKLEAAIALGAINSRMKDFYDIWLIMRRFKIDTIKLTEAIKKTFEHRNTSLPTKRPLFAEEIYDEASDRQTLWRAFIEKGEIKHVPESLSAVALEIEDYLFPLL